MENVFVLDGGFSSQLSKHVTKPVDGHPLWTARFLATDPEAVMQTHLDFLNAGSDIISTNTYQASVPNLMKYLNLSENEALATIKKAVDLAKKARDTYLKNKPNARIPKIAGSIGPYGACLNDASEYSGSYEKTTSIEQMMEFHKPRMQALFEAGIDCFAFETVPCKKEADLLVELLKEFPTMKAWLSFSCRRDGKSIASGDNFQEVAIKCYDSNPKQIMAIGVNCIGPEIVEILFNGINKGRENNPIPLLTYPNSGEIFDKEWKGKEMCVPINTYVPHWIEIGVKYIGGCCRTYADDIKDIAYKIQK